MNIRFTILILIYVSIISCSKQEGNTWEENRDALIGSWNGEVSFVKTNLNDLGFEITIEFNWVYQAEPETIVFSAPDQTWHVGLPLSFKLINKDKNRQVWKTEYSDYDYNPITKEYTEYKIKEIWKMTKK